MSFACQTGEQLPCVRAFAHTISSGLVPTSTPNETSRSCRLSSALPLTDSLGLASEAAQLLRCPAEGSDKTLAHPVRIREAHHTSDLIEGLPAILDHGSGRLHAQAL